MIQGILLKRFKFDYSLRYVSASQEAQKSFTAAVVALSGVVSRPAIDAVRNGSQIADRFSITWFSGKQKRTRFQCFHIS